MKKMKGAFSLNSLLVGTVRPSVDEFLLASTLWVSV